MLTHTSKPNYSYSTNRVQERKKKESRQNYSVGIKEPPEQENSAESTVGEWGSITSNVMRTIESGEYQPAPGWEQHMAQPGKARVALANMVRAQQMNNSISSTPQTEGIQLRAAIPTVPKPSRPPAFQLKARPTGLAGESVIQNKVESTDSPAVSPARQRPNHTGLPNNLKAGIENLSGFSMDDVRVHYNSSKPSKFLALALTQGTDIHVAPGQEKHLPHEAWHVVQQKEGRVKATKRMKGGEYLNDEKGLEKEAEQMGRSVHASRSLYQPNRKHRKLGTDSGTVDGRVVTQLNGITIEDAEELAAALYEVMRHAINNAPAQAPSIVVQGLVEAAGLGSIVTIGQLIIAVANGDAEAAGEALTDMIYGVLGVDGIITMINTLAEVDEGHGRNILLKTKAYKKFIKKND